jgi:short-subunit dehydrogenase
MLFIGHQTHYFKANVACPENVNSIYNEIVNTLGPPTILIANAGVFSGKTLINASNEDIRRTFDVNVLGVLFCIQVFLPAMIAANHGHILFTSSINAHLTAANAVDYSSSKAALMSIVEGLQTELKHKYGNPNVKASAIFPGVVQTKMSSAISQPVNDFIMPVLDPAKVAKQIIQILSSGQR